MGYSMTWERHEKLEKLRRENRLCVGATRTRGGCASRATVKEYTTFWITTEDKAAGKEPYRSADADSGMTLCKRHAFGPGYEGGNFTVIRSEGY